MFKLLQIQSKPSFSQHLKPAHHDRNTTAE